MSDIETIKKIRDMTGFSFAEIRKALEESGGDQARTLEILKAHGAEIAAKKESRSTGQGIIECYIHSDKKTAAAIKLLCETDFVAKNPLFINLAHEIAMHVTAMDPENVKELLGQAYIKDQDLTITDLINEYISKLGENIKVEEFYRLKI